MIKICRGRFKTLLLDQTVRQSESPESALDSLLKKHGPGKAAAILHHEEGQYENEAKT